MKNQSTSCTGAVNYISGPMNKTIVIRGSLFLVTGAV